MGSKYKKIVDQFYALCHNQSGENVNIESYLKGKSLQLANVENMDWKSQLMQAYGKLKTVQGLKERITVICEQLISQTDKIIKSKDMEMQMILNQLHQTRNFLEQEKQELSRIQKQHQLTLKEEKHKTMMALEKLEEKQYELHELEQKIQQYEEEIQEIKSTEYQHMMNSIKEEEILNSQTQTLFKENTLLKHQIKQANTLNHTLNKIITQIKTQAETYQVKYQKTKKYLHQKLHQQKTKKPQQKRFSDIRQKSNKMVQTPINLIEFKDDFSFKDSIENDNQSMLVPNHPPSFLHFDSSSERFYGSQESPSRCLRQRDILNLTDRDPSTHSKNSKNITKHLLRSKPNFKEDKQNISENTWDYNDFNAYQDGKNVSKLGSKKHQKTQKVLQSNDSIEVGQPSERRFVTQERSSLLSKHRRIKSSFCGKSIHEFQEYENSHFIMNSEKLSESMMENTDRKDDNICQQDNNNIEDESSIIRCDVNQIEINEELLSSYKPKTISNGQDGFACSVEQRVTNSMDVYMGGVDAKMISSVQIKPELQNVQTKTKLITPTPQLDLYYAFFSLTVQCAKLNYKNFNQAIAVYFNLEQEYNNVLKKMIPINKWYNYIQDQIQTSIKYRR